MTLGTWQSAALILSGFSYDSECCSSASNDCMHGMKPRHGRLVRCYFDRLSCPGIAATSVGEGTLWSRLAMFHFD